MDNGMVSGGCGVLLLDKPEKMTSHDAVNRVRRLFDTKSVGHTGTLDPMATGMLILLIGRAVKASEYFSDGDKRYSARIRLGVESDTEDIWGNVIKVSDKLPDAAAVIAAGEKFRGEIMQVPPMFSALKRDGKKLVDLARSGITVEREARKVTVRSIEVFPTEREDEYRLEVCCSKGTYIRTLCSDIGKTLGCGAVMSGLRRTEACGFGIAEAYTLERLGEMSMEERLSLLLPTEDAFPSYPRIVLDGFYAALAGNGNEIYQKKINTDIPKGERVLLFDKIGMFAFGEVREYPDGSAIKPIKQIRIQVR